MTSWGTFLEVKKDVLLGRVISKVENGAYGDAQVNWGTFLAVEKDVLLRWVISKTENRTYWNI